MARWFIFAGIVLIVIGLVLHFIPNALSWFGKLPGDINIQKENSCIVFPITSMIIISIVLSLFLNIFNR